MIKLKSIIQQLKEKEANDLIQQFKESKAEKYLTLFTHYRENKISDEEIQGILDVNTNAYYTLKSRLFDKIQEFLSNNLDSPVIDLLRKVANIPNLVYNTHRDTAIAILLKLEAELRDYDMPYELSSVYNALKKLSLHSPKYYEYTQAYNRHVAYTLALDKAEDLLANFSKTLSDYHASKNSQTIDILALIKEQVGHTARLYESHHLQVYKCIIDISFALFVPRPEAVKDDEPVEDLLAKMEKIFLAYPKDTNYQHLNLAYNFLAFEYYHQLKLYKKEAKYFDVVNENLQSFLLFNHCAFTSRFLVSKMERYVMNDMEKNLYEENVGLQDNYEPDKQDIPNYINYMKYLSVSAFYAKKYQEAVSILSRLVNDVSFKNHPHAEIEIKLLLSLFYSMINKYDPANSLMRSVARKVRESEDEIGYENASIFNKILSLQMSSSAKDVEQKIKQQFQRFEMLNNGSNRMLEFLKFDDAFIKHLAQGVKTN